MGESGGDHSSWPSVETVRKAARGKSPEVFSLADKILQFLDTYPTHFEYQVDTKNQEMVHKYWNIAFCAAAHRLYRAIEILVEAGLEREAHIQARSLLELAGNQAFMAAEPETRPIDFVHQVIETKKLLSQAMKQHKLIEDEAFAEMQTRLATESIDIGKTIGESSKSWEKIKRPFDASAYDRIKKGGMHWHYDLLYFYGSDITHMGGLSVEWYLDLDPDTQFLVKRGPDTPAVGVLLVATDIILRVLYAAESVVHEDSLQAIDSLARDYWEVSGLSEKVDFDFFLKSVNPT